MYTPKGIINLSDVKESQIRLGLQGQPASGKTTSALTAPNPIVLDCDHGLSAFSGSSFQTIPMWDEDWVLKYEDGKFKKTKPEGRVNRKAAIEYWLRKEAMQLTQEQTLVIDSWSTLQDYFDEQQALEPKITKTGSEDDYDFWAKKIDYSTKIMQIIASLKCNVIVTFHELQTRDLKTGQLLEKTQPLMQGKFVTKIKLYFTDFFRMLSKESLKDGKEVGCTYRWQVKSSMQFDAKTQRLIPDDVFDVEPNWSIFEKYKRKFPVG